MKREVGAESGSLGLQARIEAGSLPLVDRPCTGIGAALHRPCLRMWPFAEENPMRWRRVELAHPPSCTCVF